MTEPLIYTSKGNIPIASLRYEPQWEVTADFIKFSERYFLGDELVKEGAHVYLPKGIAADAAAALMANSQAMCTSFKTELLNGIHAFGTTVTRAGTGADTFKASLRLTSDSAGAGTTTYSSTGELAATGNYTAGGVTLTWNAPTSTGTTAYSTPTASFSWTTLTSSGAFDAVLLYNSTQSNKAVSVHTFSSQSITAANFTLTMPTNDSTNALVRIA